MQIEPSRADRHENAVDIMSDLPGGRPIRLTREGAIEVAGIERRDPGARHSRRQIGRRHDNDAAADVGYIKVMDETSQSYLPFIFVAMVAGHHQDGRAVAVLDHGDRNVDHAVA